MHKGLRNSIGDVPGVAVGHVTLDEKITEEESICTGVTAILPHGGNWFEQKTPAASFVLKKSASWDTLITTPPLFYNWRRPSPCPES